MTDAPTLRKSATAARRAGRIAWAADMDEAADAIDRLAAENAGLRKNANAADMGLLGLIADIRKAAGDPTGKLMQDELIAHIADLRALKARMTALADRWDAQAAEHGVRQFTGNDHALFANELRVRLVREDG